MRLRLADLEEARANPIAFIERIKDRHITFRGPSKYRVLQYSIYDYHRRNENLIQALQYLRSSCHRHFKSIPELGLLEAQLAGYASAYQSLGNVVIEFMRRTRISIQSGLVLSGEVPRLDWEVRGGYAVWMLARNPYCWRSELRMPLLQSELARRMGVSSDQVTVGMYFLETSEYDRECFSDVVIQEALEEVKRMASLITSIEP